MKWHCNLQEGLDLPDYNSNWGLFPPNNRINKYRSDTLLFFINHTKAYKDDILKEMQNYKVLVAKPGAG